MRIDVKRRPGARLNRCGEGYGLRNTRSRLRALRRQRRARRRTPLRRTDGEPIELPFRTETPATLRALVVDDSRSRTTAALLTSGRASSRRRCENGTPRWTRSSGSAPMFLDVRAGLDGFGVIELLEPSQCPAVIFVRVDKYPMRAFDVCGRLSVEAVRAAPPRDGRVMPPRRSPRRHSARLHALVENVRRTSAATIPR